MSEKCYSVTIEQTLKRTLTLPIPKSGLSQKEIEEVLSRMTFDEYFNPEPGHETRYGDGLLDIESGDYKFKVEDDEDEDNQYAMENHARSCFSSYHVDFSECYSDFCNDFEETYENKLLPEQPNQSSNL